jgi:hypothetical protein
MDLRSPTFIDAAGVRLVDEVARTLEFRSLGDDVLVRCEYPAADGGPRVVWSLYQFAELRLIRAQTFASEREALAHAA